VSWPNKARTMRKQRFMGLIEAFSLIYKGKKEENHKFKGF